MIDIHRSPLLGNRIHRLSCFCLQVEAACSVIALTTFLLIHPWTKSGPRDRNEVQVLIGTAADSLVRLLWDSRFARKEASRWRTGLPNFHNGCASSLLHYTLRAKWLCFDSSGMFSGQRELYHFIVDSSSNCRADRTARSVGMHF